MATPIKITNRKIAEFLERFENNGYNIISASKLSGISSMSGYDIVKRHRLYKRPSPETTTIVLQSKLNFF